MRYLLFLLLLISSVTYSQSNVDFRGDSARFYKNGGSMEVVIRNSTKDSTNGVLTNIGNGVTRFLKFRVSNDSLFLGNTFIVLTGGGSSDVQLLGDTALRVGTDTVFFNKGFINVYNGNIGDTLARDSSDGLIIKSLNVNIPSIYKSVTPLSISYDIDQFVRDSIRTTVITRGLTGYDATRYSNDSIFRYKIRDSVTAGIIISQAPDSALVIRTNAWIPGGNSYGADTSIGTNDNFAMLFKSNALPRGRITREGQLQWGRSTASDSIPYRFQLFGRQRIVHDTLTTDGILKVHSSVGTLNNTQVWSAFRRTDGAATWGVDMRGTVDTSNSSALSRTVELALIAASNFRINAASVTATGSLFVDGLLYPSSAGINATSELKLTSATVLRPQGTAFYAFGQDLSNTNNPVARIDASGSAEFGGDFAANFSDKNWSAALEVKSTNNKTFLLPRLTTTQMNNIRGVKYINIEGVMSGYDGTSTLTWTGGGGTGLTTTLTVSGGRITDVVVTNWGTGYTSAPTAVLGGAGTGAVVTARFGDLVAGMQIYNTTENAVFTWDGTRWTGFRYNGTKFQGWDGSAWVDLN